MFPRMWTPVDLQWKGKGRLLEEIARRHSVKGLLASARSDVQVLASALESIQDSGSVIYLDHNGYVYDPAGQIVFGIDGQPLRVQTKIVAKLNSLQNLKNVQGMGKAHYVVGGRSYLKDLPDHLKHIGTCPIALELTMESVEALEATSHTADNRRPAAEERAAIVAVVGTAVATVAYALRRGWIDFP